MSAPGAREPFVEWFETLNNRDVPRVGGNNAMRPAATRTLTVQTTRKERESFCCRMTRSCSSDGGLQRWKRITAMRWTWSGPKTAGRTSSTWGRRARKPSSRRAARGDARNVEEKMS